MSQIQRRFQFSSMNLLFLMVAVAACCVAYGQRRQLLEALSQKRELEHELDNSRPIPFRSVAQQVRMATQDIVEGSDAVGIQYNSLRDRYTVQLAWTDRSGGWKSPVNFEPDGKGRYIGLVAFKPYAKVKLDADGNETAIPLEIVIKDDVARLNDLSDNPHFNRNWKVKD